MATNIFKFDGSLLTTVADGALDQAHASIKFPGRGYRNYGAPVSENLLWMLENFAGTVQPPFPVTGQLWYDTNAGSGILKVYTGIEWIVAGGVISSDVPPTNQLNQGAFWYDNVNLQLNTYNGTGWDIVGPLGSKVNNDPKNPPIPPNSVIEAIQVDAVDGTTHQLWRISVGGLPLAILSTSPAFTPNSTIFTLNGFAKISPGINFNSLIDNVGLTGDNNVFRGTQNNLPKDDAVYDLGSSAKRFKNIAAMTGAFSTGLAVNTTPSAFGLEVNGTTKLTKTVTLGASNGTAPPIKWTQGTLTPTPQSGAVEFDGNNFYFTGLRNGIATRLQPIFETTNLNSQTIYVSTAGSDSNDGRAPNTPFRTIARAVKYLWDNDLTGYTIKVESGEYLEQNPIRVPARNSIVGDNLRRVIVRPVHNQLDIFHVDVNSYFFGMTFKDHRAPAFCFAFPSSTAVARIGSGQQVIEIIPKYSSWLGIDSEGYALGYARWQDAAVYIEGPSFASGGTKATARAQLVNGGIVDITVTDGGSGYTSPPTEITITSAGGTVVTAQVEARIKNGKVVAIDVISPGANYVYPVTITIEGGGGTGATAEVLLGKGIIGSYLILNAGSGYDPDRAPWVSVTPVDPVTITSSPYVQNCSSITGPFDTNGILIENVPLPYNNEDLNAAGYGDLDENGAGSGIRIDGQVVSGQTVVRSFVADAFTQLNQGGVGHLIINKGYAQFVSCFTTFSSIGYWARGGGFANISNSVIDFGNYGVVAEGYYPDPYGSAFINDDYYSLVNGVTINNSGSYLLPSEGGVDEFAVIFSGGLSPGGQAATGWATLENGKVTGVRMEYSGYGYIAYPTVDFSAGDEWVRYVGGNPQIAEGVADLIGNAEITIASTTDPETGTVIKPQVASAMLLNGNFYTVKSVNSIENTSPGTWALTVVPAIITATQGATVAFHDISNISTGGLALEYVGAGVTYNALPRYGGIPNPAKQVVDRTTDDVKPDYAQANPGVVYYVTIDNTGDFKIGPYFGVNFVDGSIRLNANAFELTNITRIGPFKRFGNTVGTYADEISKDPTLTHLSNVNYDETTITTQSAVRGYFEQVASDILPKYDAFEPGGPFSVGSDTKRWNIKSNELTAISANIETANLTSVTLGSLTVTGDSILSSLQVDGGASFAGTATFSDVATFQNSIDVTGPSVFYDAATFLNGVLIDTAGTFDVTIPATFTDTLTVIGQTTLSGGVVAGLNIDGAVSMVNGGVTVDGDVSITNGDLTVTGDITAFATSDLRLKDNLTAIPNALDKVSNIGGYTFDWNKDAKKTGRDVGVVAQEIEKVLPEVVVTREDGYKAVDYEKLVPLLIEAIKDLKEKIDRIEKKD